MQSLSDQFLAHQIYLQRYASQEAYKVQPFIKRMIKIIKDEVLKQEGTKLSNAKLRALLKDLNEQLYIVTGEWDAEIISDLEKFAAYETNWASKAISTPLPDGVNFVVPTPEQVWAAVQFAPLELNEKPVDFSKWMSSWAPSEVERLSIGVKTGFLRGTPTKEIVRQVVGAGGLADISRRNAEAIVRTAVNHVSTQAKEQVYAKNSDIITGYEWVSTLDSRTSTTCFTGETELAPIAGMSAIMRGTYSGDIITVELANGKKFSGTPEHPILTQYGWTPLKEINPREHILYTVVDEIIVLEVMQGINMPARADDIFDAFADLAGGEMVSSSPTAADFYGDGVRLNGEVDIVSTNCELRNYVNASGSETVVNELLSSVHASMPLPGYSHEHFSLIRDFPSGMPTFNEVELLNETVENSLTYPCSPDALGWGHSSYEQVNSPLLVGDRVVANPSSRSMLHESDLLEECRNGRCGDSILLGYDASGNPIAIRGTNIIGVRSELRNCHVYTLSSGLGYYAAGGAIVKNCRSRDGEVYEIGKGPLPPAHYGCRSTTAPTVSSEFDFLDKGAKRAAKGADGGTQVNAEVSYYDWLKSQPAAFQDDVLGKTKGAIFRNAGLSTDQFKAATVDRYGNPLTIKEMEEKDELIAQYLANR